MNDEKNGAVLRVRTLQSTPLPHRGWCSLARCKSRPSAVRQRHTCAQCASTFKRTQKVHGQHSKCIYKEPEGPNMEGPVSMDISRHSSLCSMMQTFCGRGRGRALLSRTVLIRRKSVWFTTANGDSYERKYICLGGKKCI